MFRSPQKTVAQKIAPKSEHGRYQILDIHARTNQPVGPASTGTSRSPATNARTSIVSLKIRHIKYCFLVHFETPRNLFDTGMMANRCRGRRSIPRNR